MSIYRKAVNNPVTTALVFAACAILGIFSLMRISIDQLPEFDANVIMVMSSYPGASAEDIETNLSKVLENALNGVSDLKDITSQSKENICLIMLEFEWGVDIDVATNDVRDKLDLVNSELPDGATIPVIFKFSADDLPIMILSATAGESLPALEKILDDKVTTPLARVSGVGTVSVTGAPQREIQVFCDPGKLDDMGCKGAPDLIIEILSPSTQRHDRLTKYNLYERAGVTEYWIVSPEERTVQVSLLSGGRYRMAELYTPQDIAKVHVLEGCFVELAKVFPQTGR